MSRGIRTLVCFFIIYSHLFHHVSAKELEKINPHGIHRLAIVIDDAGNMMRGTQDMIEMPIPLTIAVMPFLPSSTEDAKAAKKAGHEVIVHLPMEALSGKPEWLGPKPILKSLSNKEIRERIYEAIDTIPYAVGMNNHMGSAVTSDERIMRIVMEICKEKGFFFLNSMTADPKIPRELAKEFKVPYIENQLFFDKFNNQESIESQSRQLLKLLKEQKDCVAIGHVGITGPYVSKSIQKHYKIWAEDAWIVPLSQIVNDQVDEVYKIFPAK